MADAWQLCLSTTERRRKIASAKPSEPTLAAVLPTPGWWPMPARNLLDLYAPLLALAPARPFVFGHLAQGIDGTIATDGGSSRGLSGEQNHLHLHRLRALADAVIIGASTAELDDPQLTVRQVRGSNPVRLVIDPGARLTTRLRMFHDDAAPSLVVCARAHERAAITRWGAARVIAVDSQAHRLDLAQLFAQLGARGWPVVLVEGGGVTISRMIEAGCLDQLQVSVSPVVVGGARRGLQLHGPALIGDCQRPPTRVFRMGQDMVWEMNLRASRDGGAGQSDGTLTRIF